MHMLEIIQFWFLPGGGFGGDDHHGGGGGGYGGGGGGGFGGGLNCSFIKKFKFEMQDLD